MTPKKRNHIVGVMLAAGQSSRCKPHDKLQLPVDREPMIRRAVRNLINSQLDEVLVVVPESGFVARKTLIEDQDVRTVELGQTCKGLAHSLAAGIDHVGIGADAVLIALADMPFVCTDDINAILKLYQPGKIVAPSYQGKRGNPVLFCKKYFHDLACLSGDEGAKSLINAHLKDLINFDRCGPGCVTDIDTLDDWFRESFSRNLG